MSEERRLAVLRAIVQDYVATQEPVGSKALVERHGLGVSPATVRNDMAVLEEEGLIHAPHTSAGRIPTDKGYRHFVDRLSRVKPMSAAEQRAIARFLAEAQDLDRHRGRGFLDLLALVVDECANTAAFGAADEDVADLQRAVLGLGTEFLQRYATFDLEADVDDGDVRGPRPREVPGGGASCRNEVCASAPLARGRDGRRGGGREALIYKHSRPDGSS